MTAPEHSSTGPSLLDQYAAFEPDRHALWKDQLARAVEPIEIGPRNRAVTRVALGSVVHWAIPVIETHVDDAFEHGATVAELLEAIMHVGHLEAGMHGIHDGLDALHEVIANREKAGRLTPAGRPLGPEEMVPEARYPVPPAFAYQTPSPRIYAQVMQKHDPDLYAAFAAWNQARSKLRKGLTRKMQELLIVAVDVAIYWPEPAIDHHLHVGFEVGATVQEMLEVTLVTAAAVGGARATNFAARSLDGGPLVIDHGVKALDRVLAERDGAGLLAPRDARSPRVGRIALTT